MENVEHSIWADSRSRQSNIYNPKNTIHGRRKIPVINREWTNNDRCREIMQDCNMGTLNDCTL